MPNAPAINTQEDRIDSNDNQYKFLIGLVFILVSPITILSAVTVYIIFSYAKVKRSVIALFSLPMFIIPLFFLQKALGDFAASWTTTFPQIFEAENKLPIIMEMLGQQFWIAVPLGVLAGLGFASWRWFTRARWQEWQFRRTPWEIFATKKTIQKIKNDEDTPKDGMTLGIDMNSSDRIVQTYQEAGGHTFLVGGSGAGKTRTAFSRIRDQIKNGDAVAVVDLKADPELTNIIKIYCDRYGRKMKHFTLQDIGEPYTGPAEDGPAHYDPLAQGDHTRRADMVLDLRDWDGAEFYKKLTQSYLQLLFTVHINNPPKEGKSALEDAIALMSPKYLQERARPLASNPQFSSIVASIDALNDEKMSNSVRENLQTNRSQLEIFLQGIAGPWLTYDKGGNNISLIDTVKRGGDVIVFSLDSQAYPTLSADIANLIIQDLKTVSSALLKEQNEVPFHIFIDEFSAIGSDNIVGLINKARASKMFVTIATQTLGDLVVKNPALRMQIMGIISSFIIHRANTEEDAIVYAGLTGMTKVSKVRQNVEQTQNIFGGLGTGIGTGNASVEEVEQWKVMPHEIQALSVGEMFYINTHTHRIKNVKCIIEDIADPNKGGTAIAGLSNESHHKSLSSSGKDEKLSLEKSEEVPSLAELLGKSPSDNSKNPSIPVNQQLTADSFIAKEEPPREEPPRKEKLTNMFGKKNKNTQDAPQQSQSNASKTKEAFDEVKDMEKVEINYDLLRTFFNDPTLVDEQEREDIEDGVASPKTQPRIETPAIPVPKTVLPKPVVAAPQPAAAKSSPFAPKQTGTRVPTRPALPAKPEMKTPAPPAKSEFDF
jgi:hypothetical protein